MWPSKRPLLGRSLFPEADGPLRGVTVSPEDLRGWGGRELLLAIVSLAVVLALVVIALVDWASL